MAETNGLPVIDFCPGSAEAGQAVTVSVSGARFFDKGDWDKIPYTVKVTTHILFTCAPEDVAIAEETAFRFASDRAQTRLTQVVPELLEVIENDLYPDLFAGTTDEA